MYISNLSTLIYSNFNRFVRALIKHGDLLPSLRTALNYVGMETAELPLPFLPLKNDVPLLKDLAELNVDKWK